VGVGIVLLAALAAIINRRRRRQPTEFVDHRLGMAYESKFPIESELYAGSPHREAAGIHHGTIAEAEQPVLELYGDAPTTKVH